MEQLISYLADNAVWLTVLVVTFWLGIKIDRAVARWHKRRDAYEFGYATRVVPPYGMTSTDREALGL